MCGNIGKTCQIANITLILEKLSWNSEGNIQKCFETSVLWRIPFQYIDSSISGDLQLSAKMRELSILAQATEKCSFAARGHGRGAQDDGAAAQLRMRPAISDRCSHEAAETSASVAAKVKLKSNRWIFISKVFFLKNECFYRDQVSSQFHVL